MVSQVLLRVWYQGRALTPEFSSLTRFNLNFQEERRRGGQEFSVLSSRHGFYNSSNKFSTNGHGLQVAAHSQVSYRTSRLQILNSSSTLNTVTQLLTTSCPSDEL
jgi:hypothetical protein